MRHKSRIYSLPIILFLCSVLAIVIPVLSVIGCNATNGNAGLESPMSGSTTDSTTSILAWDAPTTYTDGSALLDLKEYRVYFSTSPDPYSTGKYYSVSAPATSVEVKDVIALGTGTYYFVVTAVDSTGWESIPSNEVSRNLN
jgi:fibronectin type 3 domain-containing protein